MAIVSALNIITMIHESEKALEARLRREVERRGGIALKHTAQYHRGIPDRIILLPNGLIVFVELKSTGKKPTPLQIRAMEKLTALGFRCFVIDSTERLNELLTFIDKANDLQTARIPE